MWYVSVAAVVWVVLSAPVIFGPSLEFGKLRTLKECAVISTCWPILLASLLVEILE